MSFFFCDTFTHEEAYLILNINNILECSIVFIHFFYACPCREHFYLGRYFSEVNHFTFYHLSSSMSSGIIKYYHFGILYKKGLKKAFNNVFIFIRPFLFLHIGRNGHCVHLLCVVVLLFC